VEGVFAILKLPDLLGHLIAFLILFWVLKKYLWGYILETVERRRANIELAYQEVEAKDAEVTRLRDELSGRLERIEEERRLVLEQAAKEGRALADEIRAHAEAQRERVLAKAQADIGLEREKLRVEMNNYAAELAINIAEKLLQARLDREEQRRLIRSLTAGL